MVEIILDRHFRLETTNGSNNKDAPKNRSKVKENGLIIPASFSEARKEPATNNVAIKTSI